MQACAEDSDSVKNIPEQSHRSKFLEYFENSTGRGPGKAEIINKGHPGGNSRNSSNLSALQSSSNNNNYPINLYCS